MRFKDLKLYLKMPVNIETLIDNMPEDLRDAQINVYMVPATIYSGIEFLYNNGFGISCIDKNGHWEIIVKKNKYRNKINISDREFYDILSWNFDYDNPVTKKYVKDNYEFAPIYAYDCASVYNILKDVKALDDRALTIYAIKTNIEKITNIAKETIVLIKELNK